MRVDEVTPMKQLDEVTPMKRVESRHMTVEEEDLTSVTVEDVEWEQAMNEVRKPVKRKLDVEPKSCDEVCTYCCMCKHV